MGIEHAIVTKDAEVTDAPSRFLALLYFFRPSLIVSLHSLVYGLEGESPPDAALCKAAEVEVKREQKKGAVSGGGVSALKALGSVLAFFSRLEMFCMRIGVAWILRDPIIILIILLVLVVQPILAGALTIWRLGRKSLCGERSHEGNQSNRQHATRCKSGDLGALAHCKAEPLIGSPCAPRVRHLRQSQS